MITCSHEFANSKSRHQRCLARGPISPDKQFAECPLCRLFFAMRSAEKWTKDTSGDTVYEVIAFPSEGRLDQASASVARLEAGPRNRRARMSHLIRTPLSTLLGVRLFDPSPSSRGYRREEFEAHREVGYLA